MLKIENFKSKDVIRNWYTYSSGILPGILTGILPGILTLSSRQVGYKGR